MNQYDPAQPPAAFAQLVSAYDRIIYDLKVQIQGQQQEIDQLKAENAKLKEPVPPAS